MAQLPEEIWLQVISYVPPRHLWLGMRNVSKRLRACVEDHITSEVLKQFSIGVQFSLGSGRHHRWYDIRGTITFAFQHLNNGNPNYALFASPLVHPEPFHERVMDCWRHMDASGVEGKQEWRVQYAADEETRTLYLLKAVMRGEEKCIFAMSEVGEAQGGEASKARSVDSPKVVMGGEEGCWIDWKEMLSAYYHTPAPRRSTGIVDVAGYLTP